GIMAGRPVAPPGLEYLFQVNGLLIKETRKSIFQSSNTYDLFGTDGQLVYQATEKRKFFGPRMDLRVTNTKGNNVLNLLVPLKCSLHTKVLSADKTRQIGVITRVWRGLSKEMFSSKNNYTIDFPMDLHVSMKAMLMACTLLIVSLIL
ncbi:hypothetical protein AB205_0100170, partial [Aquarana catesbeiana]